MDPELVRAAERGNIEELGDLLTGNPFLLKPAELSGGENALHIACMNNRAEFVKKMLCYRLEFAKELNRDGFSPLHIASAYGHLETVKELLKVGPRLCLVKGKDGRIPLHYAVMEGKIHVINELLSANLNTILELTVAKETCFHIAIKYGHDCALVKLMIRHVMKLPTYMRGYVVNKRDDQGNSVLHLTASMSDGVLQVWLQELKSVLNINSRNNRSGLTPLDILVSEGADDGRQQMLRLAGAKGAKDINRIFLVAPKSPFNLWSHIPSDNKSLLLVVLVLIATATYQGMINPPGGLWQGPATDNNATNAAFAPKPATNNNITSLSFPLKPGQSLMAIQNPGIFFIFFTFNFLGFAATIVPITYIIGTHSYLFWFPLFALVITYYCSLCFYLKT